MLKKISQAFLILALTMSCKQDAVHQFKQEIKPNKTYIKQLTNSTNSVVNFIADQETLDLIESNGYKLPIKTEIISKMNMDIITKNKDEKGEFLAEKQYGEINTSFTINGKTNIEQKPYSGMRILGKYDSANKFFIDSIVGIQLLPQMKYFHNVIIENMQSKIKFPQNGIKIGDTIKNEMPLDIPVQGMSPVKALIKMQYVFQAIKGEKAIFKLISKAQLDTKWGQENTQLSGTGIGTSEFDLKENYLTSHSYVLPLELTIIVNDEMTAKIKITMKSEQSVSIK